MTEPPIRYSIDSDSLIACRRIYPADVFPGVWNALDTMVRQRSLFAHEEVWNEINKGSDALTDWAAPRKAALCIPTDEAQLKVVQSLATLFKDRVSLNTTDEHRADPWIVALAKSRSLCVVSEERGMSSGVPKVPQMCDALGVRHMRILELMRAEGWTF